MNLKKIALFALFLSLANTSCSKDDDNGPKGPVELPKLDIASLREAPVKMGAAVDIASLKNNAEYRALVIREFSSLTGENAMKMDALSTGQGTYKWDDADYLVSFAAENGMRVHGHTLIWYRTTPYWVEAFQGDAEAWKAMMKQYIQDVVGHFRGKVASWDVVNEVMNDDGTMRDCIWREKIGDEYVELAFQYAHEADPDALLFYNEYGQDYSYLKNQKVCEYVKGLIEKGVPVHGIGLQMHTHAAQTEQHLKYAVRSAAATGLKVHVSELDVAVNPDKKPEIAAFTDSLATAQQATYRYVAQAMNEIPAEQAFGITTWGVVDTHSWLTDSPDWPLIFDGEYRKKPAYDGLLEGFYKE